MGEKSGYCQKCHGFEVSGFTTSSSWEMPKNWRMCHNLWPLRWKAILNHQSWGHGPSIPRMMIINHGVNWSTMVSGYPMSNQRHPAFFIRASISSMEVSFSAVKVRSTTETSGVGTPWHASVMKINEMYQ